MTEENSLIGIPKINRENIDPRRYTLSLLKEGARAGLLSKSFYEKAQEQLFGILGNSIAKYCGYDSTSVKAETARDILSSLLYRMDLYLTRAGDFDRGLTLLTTRGILKISEESLSFLQKEVAESQELLEKLTRGKLPVDLIAYNDTIDKALPEFFKEYDPEFFAQETMAGIDYPLALDHPSLCGIAYIRRYIEKLIMENEFCRLFPHEIQTRILSGYGAIYRADYRELLTNLFELILNNAIFTTVLKKDVKEPILSGADCEMLQKMLQNPSTDFTAVVREGARRVIEDLQIESFILQDYIMACQSSLVPRLAQAVKQNALQSLVICGQEYQNPKIHLSGEKLTDEDFLALSERILLCTNGKAKADIILSGISSLEDFVDILGANCLFKEEYDILFDSLGDTAIALLAAKVFEDEIIQSFDRFSVAGMESSPFRSEWENLFTRYLKGLSESRLDELGRLLFTFFGRA